MNHEKFQSRLEAGKRLAIYLKNTQPELFKDIRNISELFCCFAVANGGVPIAEGLCSLLKIDYDILIVRKIKIPYNPEAGFGSITSDGTIMLNEELLKYLNLSDKQINQSIDNTIGEIQSRLELYNKAQNLNGGSNVSFKNRNIFIVDDGLASGFTMLAAIEMIKKYAPKSINVLVPTAPLRTIEKLKDEADLVLSLHISTKERFAVANAYANWYDLTETEVLHIIEQSKYYKNLI